MKNIFLFFVIALSTHIATAATSYRTAGEIPFKGQGGWDYLNIDPATNRLFVSHSDRVVVIDTSKKKIISEILDTPGVHGIALAPELNKAYSSNGKEGKVSVIDLKTLTTKTKIKVGDKPDAIAYDPSSQEIYVFNGNSKSLSIIDAKTDSVIATVALPGKPEFAAVDSVAHRVFVNIEDKNSLSSIDTKTHKLLSTWELKGCDSPSGLAIDTENHRLFSVCENQKMIMTDAQSGRVIASIDTGAGTDGVAYDTQLHLAFSANGKSGTLTIVNEENPEKLTLVQNMKSAIGARTIILNPKDHKVYLPTADFTAAAANESRPKPIDGTQKVLIFEN
jgi:YVTN family beta-propeller protein